MGISAADYMMISEIVDFWFDGCVNGVTIPNEIMHCWFNHEDSMDHEISLRFRQHVELISDGTIKHWSSTAKGRLALIILADQFNRHLYRDTPRMYALDQYALKWTIQGIKQRTDMRLLPVERLFFYMPLQHAEDQTLQTLSVLKFNQLYQYVAKEHPAAIEPYKNSLDYAIKHQQVIKEFGRFPHRNKILGRHPTKYEADFLSQPQTGF